MTVSVSSNDGGSLNVPLLAEDKNAFLPGEAHFLYLAIFPKQNCVIVGFRLTIFPTAFAFGHHGLTLLHGGFVAVDQQAILPSQQIGFADLCSLGDVNGLVDRLSKYGHGQRGYRQQRYTAKKRIGFHARQFLSIGSSQPNQRFWTQ